MPTFFSRTAWFFLLCLSLPSLRSAEGQAAAPVPPSVPAPDIPTLRKKAAAGDPPSQLALASIILAGNIKDGKLEEAAALLEKSAEAGHAPAQLAFARFLVAGSSGRKPDPERARFLIQQAAEAGHPVAQTTFANLLLSEVDLKARDIDFGPPLAWFRKAAAQNEPEALCRLGLMTAGGQGVPVNLEAGWKLIHQSAQLGFPLALNEAGICLQRGRGVAEDGVAAIGYYHAAADLGNAAAMVNLALCYEKGHGIPQSYQNAGAAYARAAKAGFAMAQFGLARLFAEGLGTAKNPVYAYVNYSRAAASIPEAVAFRDKIKATLTKVQLAEADKLLTDAPEPADKK